ncbi:MAG: hypothetical protein QM809_01140 [Gordonia sp. (in: high G+C Gram-positive bacteria)]|uniref:hypothetical protein n=1 Tax=Gordonia sp. (in: high G+C Gram-positive bacteria) TaxID=84139 RepID=UPI0039E25456
MTPDDQRRATAVADRLLSVVRDHCDAECLRQDYDAGEMGMVLERALVVAEQNDVLLPAGDVREAWECLIIPGMVPPRTDLARLRKIVDNRLADVTP